MTVACGEGLSLSVTVNSSGPSFSDAAPPVTEKTGGSPPEVDQIEGRRESSSVAGVGSAEDLSVGLVLGGGGQCGGDGAGVPLG